MGASPRRPAAMASFGNSRSERWPVRTRARSTRASEQSMRMASCSFAISSETTAGQCPAPHVEVRIVREAHAEADRAPGRPLPRRVDVAPHTGGNQIAVGLILLPSKRRPHLRESGFLPEDADLLVKGADRLRVGDVELKSRAPVSPVLDEPAAEGGDHAEAQEEVLHLSRHALAGRAEPELRLPARQHGGPAVGREQPIQKAGELVAAQREDRLRDELLAGGLPPEAERLEPAREQ